MVIPAGTDVLVEHGPLGEAHFSKDQIYRYLLTRLCGNAAPSWWITYVMLNPSTATHEKNDPTIAKTIKFGHRFCEGWQGPRELLGIRIVNLYAFRATKPKVCFAYPKPVGGVQNDRYIVEACRDSAIVIAAWGVHTRSIERSHEVRRMLVGEGIRLHRLGDPTKDGFPPHPLYLPDDTELQEWC